VWALAAPAIVRQAARLAEAKDAARTGVRLAAFGAVFVAGHVAVASQLSLWFQPYVPVVARSFRESVVHQLSVLPVDAMVFGVLVLSGWAMAAAQTARRLALRESQLEAELARAQLEALRLEIQPPFLFNTLNAIAALIRLKLHDRALDMLVGLSELMRATLDRTGEQVCTLEAELDFTRRYADLQAARFGDRLDVVYDIDPACAGAPVPTFILQPLVENAIRHGAARQAARCRIEVAASLQGDSVHLQVSDDGAGLPPGFDVSRHAGTGLSNLRSRLARLYGHAGRLDVRRRDGCGTVVEIVVPRGDQRVEAIA
jgi:LytS/YehU family sensor histidine kinase